MSQTGDVRSEMKWNCPPQTYVLFVLSTLYNCHKQLYQLGLLVYRCQYNHAPRYLMDHCSPVSDVLTSAHQSLTSFSDSVCVRPAVIYFAYHATVSAHTVGRFLLLAPDCLELTPKTFGIWKVLRTLTDSRWRHSHSCSTSVSSAFLRECAK